MNPTERAVVAGMLAEPAAQAAAMNARRRRWPRLLTPRERDVLTLRRQGLLIKEIAFRLGVSSGRVANCLQFAERKGHDVPRRPGRKERKAG